MAELSAAEEGDGMGNAVEEGGEFELQIWLNKLRSED